MRIPFLSTWRDRQKKYQDGHAKTCSYWQNSAADQEARWPGERLLITRCPECEYVMNALPAAGKIVVDENSEYAALKSQEEEVKKISLWLRVHKSKEIENREHAGLTLSEIVIRYMSRNTQ